jgi:hypothetical protein
MAQRTATQHWLVACEHRKDPQRTSLVERRVVERLRRSQYIEEIGWRYCKKQGPLSIRHRMDRPPR